MEERCALDFGRSTKLAAIDMIPTFLQFQEAWGTVEELIHCPLEAHLSGDCSAIVRNCTGLENVPRSTLEAGNATVERIFSEVFVGVLPNTLTV